MIGQLKAIKIAYLKKFTNTKPNIACPVQISPIPSCQEIKQIYTISVWNAKQVSSYLYMIANIYSDDII
jgi:hypothetical protein